MNIKKIYLFFAGIIVSGIITVHSQETPGEIIRGFSEGNAEIVSKYFKNTVELIVNNKENIYSSTQAQIILKDFFKKNPAKSFSILHQGGKGESKYAIGNLITSQGKYRITILLKLDNNNTYIHQLRIEKDGV